MNEQSHSNISYKRCASNYRSQEKTARLIGELYQKSKRRMDRMSYDNDRFYLNSTFIDDARFCYAVERALQDCQKLTQYIVTNEYLTNHEKDWYLDKFSRSTYYSLKKKVIKEFINCLDI